MIIIIISKRGILNLETDKENPRVDTYFHLLRSRFMVHIHSADFCNVPLKKIVLLLVLVNRNRKMFSKCFAQYVQTCIQKATKYKHLSPSLIV